MQNLGMWSMFVALPNPDLFSQLPCLALCFTLSGPAELLTPATWYQWSRVQLTAVAFLQPKPSLNHTEGFYLYQWQWQYPLCKRKYASCFPLEWREGLVTYNLEGGRNGSCGRRKNFRGQTAVLITGETSPDFSWSFSWNDCFFNVF